MNMSRKKASPKINEANGQSLVMSGYLARCFGVQPMAISVWRQREGLPGQPVRSDQSALGYMYVYDLDIVEKWAKEADRPFQRLDLTVKTKTRKLPGEYQEWRKRPPARIPRLPREASP